MDYPDAKKHLHISLAKSAIRIAAGAAFAFSVLWIGGVLIIGAEILGIWEELV